MKRWSIVSSMTEEDDAPGLFGGSWRSWGILGVTLAAWIAASWHYVGRYEAGLTESYLRRESINAERDLHSINAGVSGRWEIVRSFLATLAHQDMVASALERHATDAGIGRSLTSMVGDIKVLTSIGLLDADGLCIAASNGTDANSPVGRNFGDRDYFQDARRGQSGAQFANSHATNLPGMYLSVPVTREGRFLGAVTAKFESTSFAPWLNFADSVIADQHGVILFARDASYLNQAMPGADVDGLSPAEKTALYKRTSFTALPLSRWSPDLSERIVRFEDRPVPVMLVTGALESGAATVGVMHPLPRLLLLESDRWRMFALVAIIGTVLQLIFFALLQRLQETLRRRRMAENEVAFQQSVIDAAALAIAVYAEDGHCLAANDAMADLFSTTRAMMAHQNFRLSEAWVQSGLMRAANQVLDIGAAQRGHWCLSSDRIPEVWIDATLKRFTYQTRNFLLVIFADVTDQHRRDGLMSEG